MEKDNHTDETQPTGNKKNNPSEYSNDFDSAKKLIMKVPDHEMLKSTRPKIQAPHPTPQNATQRLWVPKTKIAQELVQKVHQAEKQHNSVKKSVRELLKSKEAGFNKLFEGYISELKTLVETTEFDASVRQEILRQETVRIERHKRQLLNDIDVSFATVKRNIAAQKRDYKLSENIAKLQGVVRGFSQRKRYRRMLAHAKKRENIEAEGFYEPLKASATFNGGQEAILELPVINSIFADLIPIYSVNKEFLQQLEESRTTKSKGTGYGKVFGDLAPYLKLYTNYVNKFNTILDATAAAKERNAEFQKFLRGACKNPNIGTQTLESFQIMPIQRVPRYKLLLEQLIKYTPDDHVDFENLTKALALIEGVAKEIDEGRAIVENTKKILDIQKRLAPQCPGLFAPHRKLQLEESIFLLRDTGILDEVYIYLFNDLLLVTQKLKGLLLDTEKLVVTIEYKRAKLVELIRNSLLQNGVSYFGFQIVLAKKAYQFYAYTEDICSKCFNTVKQDVNELKSIEKTRRHASTRVNPSILKLVDQLNDPSGFKPNNTLSNSSGPSMKQNSKPKLSTIVTIFEELVKLETDMFRAPIEIQTLLPGFEKQFNPSQLRMLHSRIEALKQKLEQIDQTHTAIPSLQSERIAVQLSQAIKGGADAIGMVKEQVQQTFPKGLVGVKETRQSVADLMRWYIKLSQTWSLVLAAPVR